MIFLVICLVVLLSLSALFSAAETALFSLSSLKVKMFKNEKEKNKQLIATLLSSPKDLLVTIIMCNVSINIFVQNVVSSLFGESSNWAFSVGVPLFLTLVMGEIIPKSIGLTHNVQVAYSLSPFVQFCQKLLLPIRGFLVVITNFVSRVVFFFLKHEKEISFDEMQHALRTSTKYGVLKEEEAELVRGYLQLQEMSVKERMRPREDVLFFALHEPLSRLIHLFVDQECSRIPICENNLDSLVGIMTSRLFFLHRPLLKTTEDLRSIVEKPFFAPESIPAKNLLLQFYERQASLAIIVDEYGSISGLISLEDLVETVVGEIADRRDEKALYTRSGADVIIASGRMEIGEIENLFDVSLTTENQLVTIGGYLTEKLGDIPKSGSKWVTDKLLFQVLSADPNRVRRVYIRRLRKR